MNATLALGAAPRRQRPAPSWHSRLLAATMLTSLALVGLAAIGTVAVRLVPADQPATVAAAPEVVAPPPALLLAVAGGQVLSEFYDRARDWAYRQDYQAVLRSLDRPPPVAAPVLTVAALPQMPAKAVAPPRRPIKRNSVALRKPPHAHRVVEAERPAETRDAPLPGPVQLAVPSPPDFLMPSRPPGDADARRRAVADAIARGELGRADRLVQDGMALAPDDPLVWLAAADVARARDDKRPALRDLRRALELRLRQLGTGCPVPAGVSLRWGDPPDYRPAVIHVGLIELVQNAPARLDMPPDLAAPAPAKATPPVADPLVPHPLLDTEPTALPTPASPSKPPPSSPVIRADPLVTRIDRDIAVVSDEVSPSARAGAGFRGRSGASRIDTLNETTVPLEATVSPGGRGTLKLAATPTFLDAGRVDAGSRRYFGTLALPLGPPGQSVADQHAEGLGLDLGYTLDGLAGDLGSTPLGFRETNAVGGLEWALTVADRTRLRLTAERRAVTDSLLSYAGTRDGGIGRDWGGVTRSRGHVTLETSIGPVDLYAGGGYGSLDGHHVKSNAEGEAGAGGSFALFKTADGEARLGLDLVYYGYDRNLRFFSYGQGGYFSPQRYVAALLPLTYKARLGDDLSYELGATVGVQSYHEDQSAYFPLDPALQARLAAAYPGRDVVGFAGGAHGSLDYRVTPRVHVGAKAEYRHAGDYDDGSALVYARYIFNGAAP